MTAGYIRHFNFGQFTLPISIHIDVSKLNLALTIAEQVTTRKGGIQKVVDSTAYHIVKRVINDPTAYVPISRMDAELGTAVSLKVYGTGTSYASGQGRKVQFVERAGKTSYASGRMVALKRSGAANAYNAVPLAAAIIQSSVLSAATSASSFSRYNQLTNFRYARQASPFKGKKRAAGRAAMRAAVHRMIASRHSSSKFLISGWVEVKRLLLGKIYDAEAPAIESTSSAPKGEIQRRGEGSQYSLTISNLVGMAAGPGGDNTENYNRALHRHGGPVLQRAIDEQAEDMLQHYWHRYFKEDLQPAWETAVR